MPQRTGEMRAAAQVQIRRAGFEDCAAIADLLYQSFVEYKAQYTGGGFAATTPAAEQIRIRMREGPVWVARCNGVAVGTVSAVKKCESIYIRGMAVLAEARGSGAGTRLLEKVESWAASERVARLFLSTTPFLDSAIRLYERSGFRRIEDPPHDLFGTPLFTMEKTISK